MVKQTVVQGENAAQPSNQNQETVKVRSFTLPAGSRVEASPAPRPIDWLDGGRSPRASFDIGVFGSGGDVKRP